MPFTFAHPAIVLPLTKLPVKWFSLTGLIVGSIVPDFEYFFRMRVKSTYSHTIGGVFWFDLPIAIIISFLFHLIVRDSLFKNLPIFLRKRLTTFTKFNWLAYFADNWPVVLLSILIGIFSHILWENLTHDNGYIVERITLFKNEIFFNDIPIPLFKVFQHLSTLLGGLYIYYYLWTIPETSNEVRQAKYTYWVVFSVLTCLIFFLRVIQGLEVRQYGNLIVTIISATLLAFTLTPILTKKWNNGR
ncbi:DUF4184 family protein [Flavihumibacter cheonanensis]|uniref:DUF4184 family protein n=1 Tax=Flavihumibacter cheonanensis TaxID=1442385 RepID=UPI001EF8F734|nr:DUF4184 family protein [Flavihumibacter cheonanensis]MCG7754812.1 DUF4184 family protein [Flavihumibacter cheonanensis]